jgi:hypothetical protein
MGLLRATLSTSLGELRAYLSTIHSPTSSQPLEKGLGWGRDCGISGKKEKYKGILKIQFE